MLFDIFLFDKMKSIVLALGIEMLKFLSVFAPVDVKDQFFLSKDMVGVERTSCLLELLILPEHNFSNIITN